MYMNDNQGSAACGHVCTDDTSLHCDLTGLPRWLSAVELVVRISAGIGTGVQTDAT
jgi:hypothetical protein